MKKWFSGLAIALAAAVSGCTVGDHSQNDINKFSQERLEKILSATTRPASKPASRDRTLSHEEAVEISLKMMKASFNVRPLMKAMGATSMAPC